MVKILLILLSYVLGSVPTGVLAGRTFGVDVRKVGREHRYGQRGARSKMVPC
jgi:glycerol-3-phosphate acyltransferase PlsY